MDSLSKVVCKRCKQTTKSFLSEACESRGELSRSLGLIGLQEHGMKLSSLLLMDFRRLEY